MKIYACFCEYLAKYSQEKNVSNKRCREERNYAPLCLAVFEMIIEKRCYEYIFEISCIYEGRSISKLQMDIELKQIRVLI
jgi:hypothetical protein